MSASAFFGQPDVSMFLARSFPCFYQNAQRDELTPTSAETVALIDVANCSDTLRCAVWIMGRYTILGGAAKAISFAAADIAAERAAADCAYGSGLPPPSG